MSNASRPATIWRTIAEHYRTRILSGELKPGDKLPTARAMAKTFRTSVFSVQNAMAFLVREGFISRGHASGTTVLERVERLTRVAQPHRVVDRRVCFAQREGGGAVALVSVHADHAHAPTSVPSGVLNHGTV